MNKIIFNFMLIGLMGLTGLTHAHNPNIPPKTVDRVDVQRYMGTWYEMARLPMKYQDDCARDVKAVYTLNPDNSVRVDNSCRKADGELISAEGFAQTVDNTGSKLTVTFVPKFMRWTGLGKSGYWILRLDPEYKTVLVGTPNRKYMWILSRTPNIQPEIYQSYVQTAKEQGYDISKLIRNP